MKVLDHVMPREKTCGALDSFFGLVGPHQQLLSRVYKGYIPGAPLVVAGFDRPSDGVHSVVVLHSVLYQSYGHQHRSPATKHKQVQDECECLLHLLQTIQGGIYNSPLLGTTYVYTLNRKSCKRA